MNFTPLINADPSVQIHASAAIFALLLGAYVLFNEKGTRLHKQLGKIWVGLMVVVAVSSFFIHELRVWGDFSPIHLISIFALVSLVQAVYAARSGNIKMHKNAMKGIYWFALVITGLFTLMPGRVLSRVFLPDVSTPVFSTTTPILIAGGTVLLAIAYDVWRRSRG